MSQTSHSLPSLVERFGVKNAGAHNAVHDAPASVEVYKKLLSGIDDNVTCVVKKVLPDFSKAKALPVSPGMKKPLLIAGAALGIGMIGISNRDREPPQEEITGVRTPYGPYDTIHGINTSSHLTPFGSGRDLVKQFLNEANLSTRPWIRSSSLGYTKQSDINKVYLEDSEDDPESRGITSSGVQVHEYIQQMLMRSGQATGVEVNVADPVAKVQGSIDAMLRGNIPMEIKTVGNLRELMAMQGAKETAISQSNAYAVMTGAPYSVILYSTREDPTQYRAWKNPVNYERYRSDVARVSRGIQQIPGNPVGYDTINVNLKQIQAMTSQPEGLFDRLFHSSRREARTPAYYSPEVEPIKHGYRDQDRTRVGYSGNQTSSSHPIRSRAGV